MKSNRSFLLALLVPISMLPGTFQNVSSQPQSSQHMVVKQLEGGVIQVRIEGRSYLAIPMKPDDVDDTKAYLAVTKGQLGEALKAKADLEKERQLSELKDQEITECKELNTKHQAVLNLKNEAIDRQNEALDQKNEALDQKNVALDQKNQALDQKNEALRLKNEAIDEQLKLRDYYRELADTYRKMAEGEKWFSLSAGVGATSDKEPAALVGIGIRRFRIWAFAQESNAGVMGGFELPLF